MIVATTFVMLIGVLLTFPFCFHVFAEVECSKMQAKVKVYFLLFKLFNEQFRMQNVNLICTGSVNQTVNLLKLKKPSFSVSDVVQAESLKIVFQSGLLTAPYKSLALFELLAVSSAVVASNKHLSCQTQTQVFCGYGLRVLGKLAVKVCLFDVVKALIIQGVKNGKSANQ